MKLNGKTVEFGRFPNGELNLPLTNIEVKEKNYIDWDYTSNEDIFKLAMLRHHISQMNGVCELYISYLPYSRMDRANPYYSFTLKCFAKLINDMYFNEVVIREPHSKESLTYIDRSEPEWWVLDRIEEVYTDSGCSSIFYPDKGARDRYKALGIEVPIGYGKKVREFSNGSITDYSISGEVGKAVLIVDGLCSRCGTFIEATKHLRKEGALHIELLVAHCEDNVFTGELFDYVDRLYCSDSILTWTHPRITVLM
ncbi:MAG: ribose-phosphate pyrophosphokinase [Candidatus Peribacteraceae bacterium]|nr:ribose-phosphate pyrophosphokinase [Candidatus Peribacteraceae bacterium]